MSIENVTPEQEKALQSLWRTVVQPDNKDTQRSRHLSAAFLYDLALGELSPEQQEETREHITTCNTCSQKLVDFQTALAADRRVRAVWAPKVVRAAGGDQARSVIKDHTDDGKYLITLQPTRGGQKDLLMLEVTSAFQKELEGQNIVLVGSNGAIILQGIISGGSITRLVDQRLRDERPFRVHAR